MAYAKLRKTAGLALALSLCFSSMAFAEEQVNFEAPPAAETLVAAEAEVAPPPEAPVEELPATEAPAPATEAPVTEAPVEIPPEAPAAEAPAAEEPADPSVENYDAPSENFEQPEYQEAAPAPEAQMQAQEAPSQDQAQGQEDNNQQQGNEAPAPEAAAGPAELTGQSGDVYVNAALKSGQPFPAGVSLNILTIEGLLDGSSEEDIKKTDEALRENILNAYAEKNGLYGEEEITDEEKESIREKYKEVITGISYFKPFFVDQNNTAVQMKDVVWTYAVKNENETSALADETKKVVILSAETFEPENLSGMKMQYMDDDRINGIVPDTENKMYAVKFTADDSFIALVSIDAKFTPKEDEKASDTASGEEENQGSSQNESGNTDNTGDTSGSQEEDGSGQEGNGTEDTASGTENKEDEAQNEGNNGEESQEPGFTDESQEESNKGNTEDGSSLESDGINTSDTAAAETVQPSGSAQKQDQASEQKGTEAANTSQGIGKSGSSTSTGTPSSAVMPSTAQPSAPSSGTAASSPSGLPSGISTSSGAAGKPSSGSAAKKGAEEKEVKKTYYPCPWNIDIDYSAFGPYGEKMKDLDGYARQFIDDYNKANDIPLWLESVSSLFAF